MNILVTGANGFIASGIVESLLSGGHNIKACARNIKGLTETSQLQWQAIDFNSYTNVSSWSPLLEGIDIVINCAGILRETATNTFKTVHEDAPLALLKAAELAKVKKFIQISALGEPKDGDFIASKHRFDQLLEKSTINSIILRPSVVVAVRGSYGGTSLLRAQAALPFALFLPGNGEQKMQPILLDDLSHMVSVVVVKDVDSCTLYCAGAEYVSLKEFLLAVREWLRLPTAKTISLPRWLIYCGVWIGDALGSGPINNTIWKMIERGNVIAPKLQQQAVDITGIEPRSITQYLGSTSSFVQDRWHAKLYFMGTVARMTLMFVWMLSAVAGLVAKSESFTPVLNGIGLDTQWHLLAVNSFSGLDFILGALLLFGIKTQRVLQLMLLATCGYSLVIGLTSYELWLSPMGGLLKNLPVMVLILICLVLNDKR